MRWRSWIALLAVVGAAVGVALYAWPGDKGQPKPLAVVTAPPRQLAVVGTLDNAWDVHDLRLSQLVPRGSRAERVWYPSATKPHQQVLVEWIDSHRYYPVGKLGRTAAWGLRLWTQKAAGRWQAADLPMKRADGNWGEIRVALGDATGDRRADVLFEQYPGTNHGCGPHEVFATSLRGVTTRIFSDYLCETMLRADHGFLALGMQYFTGNEPMCCPNKHEELRLRWTGTRYVTESVHIS